MLFYVEFVIKNAGEIHFGSYGTITKRAVFLLTRQIINISFVYLRIFFTLGTGY
jgi:hypothetical protein